MNTLLTSLNEHQQEVVTSTHGPVLVLAGAGSGKTRALTHRIAYMIQEGIAHPHEIVAVTFTNKAAKEMKERIGSLVGSSDKIPYAVGTFHGLGARMLREQAAHHDRSERFVIFDAKDSQQVIRKALKDANLSLREWSPTSLKGQISRAKQAMQTPAHIRETAGSPREDVLATIYARYENILAQHDAYDFDDLLRIPLDMLRREESVREGYKRRWNFFSVDEYQDTNATQDELISLLLGEEKNICAVGDDYQAIYSWRGARVDHILEFESTHPDCKTIYLTQNYRSTPQIIHGANLVIAENTEQKHKELWTENERGEDIDIVTLQSDRDEASWVCKQLRSHTQNGGRLNQCAILYRTNAQSRALEEQFLAQRLPYTIVGGFRFYDRKEVKDALSFLYFWVQPNARLHFERLSSALLKRVGPKTIDRWEKSAHTKGISLRDMLFEESQTHAGLSHLMRAYYEATNTSFEHVSDLLSFLVEKSGYRKWLESQPDGEERWENIQELYNVTAAYQDVHAFLEDVALLSDLDTMEGAQDRVTCMTLHASKGLEFPLVYIVGCEEGLLPHSNSIGDSRQLEEERRLLYVGMTRAQKHLTLTRCEYRYTNGEMTPQLPSRFLQHLDGISQTKEEHIHVEADETIRGGISSFLHTDAPTEPVAVSVSEGEYVHHSQFGRGVVIGLQSTTATCVFEGHGVRTVTADSISSHAS